MVNAQQVGVNFLDLRNLGEDRTLVLVDGRRHVAGYPGTAAVDINTIPTDLVERVEVLTGGASAIYGADGVSGVVNFILKRDFDGLRVRAQTGISQRGDAGYRMVAGTLGKKFADDRANITLSYEFNEQDRFSQTDRLNYGLTGPSYALVRNPDDGTPGGPDDDPNVPDRVLLTDLRWADSSPGGAIDVDGDFVPDFTGEGTIYDTGSYVPARRSLSADRARRVKATTATICPTPGATSPTFLPATRSAPRSSSAPKASTSVRPRIPSRSRHTTSIPPCSRTTPSFRRPGER